MPKLTLSADARIIEKAKRLADERGTTVSALLSELIDQAGGGRPIRPKPAPITRSVRGLAKAPAHRGDKMLLEEAIVAGDADAQSPLL